MQPRGTQVRTDALREYGRQCLESGDAVARVATTVAAEGSLPPAAWRGGVLTTLTMLQGALDSMQETYDRVHEAAVDRMRRIAQALDGAGTELKRQADRYDAVDAQHRDRWDGIAETMPGEMGRTLPGEPARTLPGEPARTMPGEMGRTLPGEPARTLPGEPARTMPGEVPPSGGAAPSQ